MHRFACVLGVLAACDGVFDLREVRLADAVDASIDAAPATAMFEDGFEDGIHPRWSRALENGDECAVTTEHAVTGSYSLRCSTDNNSGSRAALVTAFVPTPTLRVQLDVRFAAAPHSFLAFLQGAHVTDSMTRRLVNADFYPSSQIDVWNYETSSYKFHPAVVNLDTWYHVDFTARMSATDGEVAIVIDGGDRTTLGPVNTTDLPINQLQIGITLVRDAVETVTVYIDNLVVTPS